MLRRKCRCGCPREFSTTRVEDLYASRACAELHTRKSALPGGEWIEAATLALRLDSHASTVFRLTQEGIIPYDIREGVKFYQLGQVVEALRIFNAEQPARKKILTKLFKP